MILGDTCTRACSYCNVKTGWPGELNVDWAEPFRLAQTVNAMDLKYTVVTSVDRDDLPDFGSSIFAMTITQIHRLSPDCKVEVLIPDFGGDRSALARVVTAGPEVLNHNIEAPRRIFSKVRPKGDYDLSLELIPTSQRDRPEHAVQVGDDGGSRRDQGRGLPNDARSSGRRLRSIDHRSISPAL